MEVVNLNDRADLTTPESVLMDAYAFAKYGSTPDHPDRVMVVLLDGGEDDQSVRIFAPNLKTADAAKLLAVAEAILNGVPEIAY